MVVVVLSACGDSAPPPEIRLGLLGVLEGDGADASGIPAHRGAELAVEERNAVGGVLVDGVRYRVRLISRGYASRGDDAAAQARYLFNRDSVHALVGPQFSVHAIPVSLLAEDAGVVMVSPMSSNPETTAGKRFVFRLAFLDDFQGEILGRFAAEDLGARRAAVVFDESSAYSRDLAVRFEASFQERGGRVVGRASFTADAPLDYREQVSEIASGRPEVVFLPLPTRHDTVLVRQIRRAGVDAVILGSDLWDLHVMSGFAEAEGSFATHQWHFKLPLPMAEAFLQRFEARYGMDPRTTAAMTYDAVNLLLDSFERAGSLDATALRDALAATVGWTGVTGVIGFEGGAGTPRRSAVISVVREGGSQIYKVVDP